MLDLELLQVKAELERNLGQLVLDCSDCGRTVHWIGGLGITPGHWAHRSQRHTASPPCSNHGRGSLVTPPQRMLPGPEARRLDRTARHPGRGPYGPA
jgi:hypothetical protein